MKQPNNLTSLIFIWLFHLLLTYSFYNYYKSLWDPRRYPTAIRLALPSLNKHSNFNEQKIIRDINRHKKIIPFEISGWPEMDNRTMEEIKVRAKLLEYTFDTTHVIKVHFTEESYYGEFVAILNILLRDRHKRYVYCNDDLYILGAPEP